jgi:uncharacterized radical SAM superfamily Fe-S cluster-containing enzyme
MSAGMPLREDRIRRYVNAFCPRCHEENPFRPLDQVERLSGYLAEAGGRVWLVRGCPVHGRVTTMYDENPEMLTYLERWTAPTKVHGPDTPNNFTPVPAGYLKGLGELQTQHTCILLEEIIHKCNLNCPTCFAGSSPDLGGIVPAREVMDNIDQRLERENGRLDVLMISGGEPTIHPEFLDILKATMQRDIIRVLVNTNGIQIARDDALVEFLEKHRGRFEVYLQFDGFRLSTHQHHRNADLRRIKQQAVERLSAAGVFTTLTMTAALGVNDDEIGDVVRFGLETPYVGGIALQPQFGSGRSGEIDPMNRLTHTGVLARLGPQTGGLVSWDDLTALPCSHPHCSSVGYMLLDDNGDWRSLAKVIGHEKLLEHLDLVSNRVADTEIPAQIRELVKASLLGLMSEVTSFTHPTVTDLFRNICDNCDLGMATLAKMAGGAVLGGRRKVRDMIGTRIKRITVKPFMDMNTMLEERLLQCCIHVGTAGETQHQCAPFCAVQAWPQLSRTKLSERAGRSLPLVETH